MKNLLVLALAGLVLFNSQSHVEAARQVTKTKVVTKARGNRAVTKTKTVVKGKQTANAAVNVNVNAAVGHVGVVNHANFAVVNHNFHRNVAFVGHNNFAFANHGYGYHNALNFAIVQPVQVAIATPLQVQTVPVSVVNAPAVTTTYQQTATVDPCATTVAAVATPATYSYAVQKTIAAPVVTKFAVPLQVTTVKTGYGY